MRIVCPGCTAAYEVPIALLKPGQAVRCARCAREWTPPFEAPEPLPPQAEPEPPPAPVPSVDIEPREEPRLVPSRPAAPPRGRNTALRLAWVASVAVLGLLVWGAYVERAAIMQLWPASIRLYGALGLLGNH